MKLELYNYICLHYILFICFVMVNSFKVEYNLYSITKLGVYQSLSNANVFKVGS